MKTKILKMVLPAFVLLLAVFGAFAFKNAENKALLAPETGWVNLPGSPCHTEVDCWDGLGTICTTIYNGQLMQAFGKTSEAPLECTKVLARRP